MLEPRQDACESSKRSAKGRGDEAGGEDTREKAANKRDEKEWAAQERLRQD